MQKYELMILVWADQNNEKSAKEAIAWVKQYLDSKWAKIFYDEYWGIRPLAYTIDKNKEGYYNVYNFEANWEIITELENFLNIDKNIIRSLVSKIEDNYQPFTKDELDEAEKVRYQETLQKRKMKKKMVEKPPIDLKREKEAGNKKTPEIKKPKASEDWEKGSIKDLDNKLEEIMKDL